MKKMMMMMVMMLAIAASAGAMNSRQARVEAQQMTEHMKVQLGLSRHQMDRVYQINLNYMLSVGTRDEIRAKERRLMELEHVLTVDQMRRMRGAMRGHQPVAQTWRKPASPASRPGASPRRF